MYYLSHELELPLSIYFGEEWGSRVLLLHPQLIVVTLPLQPLPLSLLCESKVCCACCFCHCPALAQRRGGDLCNWLWQWFSIAGAFFLYAGFAALGLVFIYGCLPETKGKKLEEIESLFENRLCTCGMSDSDEGRYIEYIRVKGSNYHLSDNDASDVE